MTSREQTMIKHYQIYLDCEALKREVKQEAPEYYRYVTIAYYYETVAKKHNTSYAQVARCVSNVLKNIKEYEVLYANLENKTTNSLAE